MGTTAFTSVGGVSTGDETNSISGPDSSCGSFWKLVANSAIAASTARWMAHEIHRLVFKFRTAHCRFRQPSRQRRRRSGEYIVIILLPSLPQTKQHRLMAPWLLYAIGAA